MDEEDEEDVFDTRFSQEEAFEDHSEDDFPSNTEKNEKLARDAGMVEFDLWQERLAKEFDNLVAAQNALKGITKAAMATCLVRRTVTSYERASFHRKQVKDKSLTGEVLQHHKNLLGNKWKVTGDGTGVLVTPDSSP